MGKRILGDVFEVAISSSSKRYFQYIADDATQLDSDVIRVFRNSYAIAEAPSISGILDGHIDFHAHVFLAAGLKQKVWRKAGHGPLPKNLDNILFRNSDDYGRPEIVVSRNWYIWRISQPFEYVGELPPRYQGAEIGVVIPPGQIINRMRNGQFAFVYPSY